MSRQEPPIYSSVQEWADAVSVYLHTLAFDSLDQYDRPLPPVLGDDLTVLIERDHTYLCMCPICRGAA